MAPRLPVYVHYSTTLYPKTMAFWKTAFPNYFQLPFLCSEIGRGFFFFVRRRFTDRTRSRKTTMPCACIFQTQQTSRSDHYYGSKKEKTFPDRDNRVRYDVRKYYVDRKSRDNQTRRCLVTCVYVYVYTYRVGAIKEKRRNENVGLAHVEPHDGDRNGQTFVDDRVLFVFQRIENAFPVRATRAEKEKTNRVRVNNNNNEDDDDDDKIYGIAARSTTIAHGTSLRSTGATREPLAKRRALSLWRPRHARPDTPPDGRPFSRETPFGFRQSTCPRKRTGRRALRRERARPAGPDRWRSCVRFPIPKGLSGRDGVSFLSSSNSQYASRPSWRSTGNR